MCAKPAVACVAVRLCDWTIGMLASCQPECPSYRRRCGFIRPAGGAPAQQSRHSSGEQTRQRDRCVCHTSAKSAPSASWTNELFASGLRAALRWHGCWQCNSFGCAVLLELKQIAKLQADYSLFTTSAGSKDRSRVSSLDMWLPEAAVAPPPPTPFPAAVQSDHEVHYCVSSSSVCCANKTRFLHWM